jgi:hypothetical protein
VAATGHRKRGRRGHYRREGAAVRNTGLRHNTHVRSIRRGERYEDCCEILEG